MKRLALVAFVALGGMSQGACGGGKGLPSLGSGGTGATGGTVLTGGVAGTGFGGSGGAAGVAGDAAVCSSTEPQTLPEFPWAILRPDAGSVSAPGDGGADAGASGCQVLPVGTYVPPGTAPSFTCTGAAWLRPDSDRPTITWDDGTQLLWNPSGSVQAVAPLTTPAGGDRRVWARLDRVIGTPCGGICGSFETKKMEVRDTAGGTILFMAMYGPELPDPSQDQLMQLFGVGANTVARCVAEQDEVCAHIRRTIHDHVLLTAPTQAIPDATLTRVTAPNGSFDVIWSFGTDVITNGVTCADYVDLGPPLGFVASRVTNP